MLKPLRIINAIKRNLATAEPLRKSLGNKMQAWQICSYGDLTELQLSEARIPIIQKPTDVLVKVEAASLNPIDKMLIRGYGRELLGFLRKYELEFPLTLGRDFSGILVDKGHQVGNELKVGDQVFGILPPHAQGSHAEAVLCCKDTVWHKPKNVNHVEAAAIAYAAVTAWSALFLTGELKFRNPKDAVVLILGASGGVGTAAIQILKSQGATVIGTCSNDAAPLVRSLGADQVFDYRDKNFEQNIAECGRYDIILDCARCGHENLPSAWKYKRFITLNAPLLVNADKYGFVGGLAASLGDIITSNFPKVIEGKTVRWGFVVPTSEAIKFVASLIEKDKLHPVIQKVFPFKEVPKAFEMLYAGHSRGKIVIDFADL